jgi:hypothetical protein
MTKPGAKRISGQLDIKRRSLSAINRRIGDYSHRMSEAGRAGGAAARWQVKDVCQAARAARNSGKIYANRLVRRRPDMSIALSGAKELVGPRLFYGYIHISTSTDAALHLSQNPN